MPLYVALFYLFLLHFAAESWKRGELPEQLGAALFIASALLSIALRTRGASSWIGLEWGVLLVDLITIAGAVALALRARRAWTIMSIPWLIIAATAHFAKLLDPHFSRLAYALMEGFSSYPVVALLGWGVHKHQRPLNARRGWNLSLIDVARTYLRQRRERSAPASDRSALS